MGGWFGLREWMKSSRFDIESRSWRDVSAEELG